MSADPIGDAARDARRARRLGSDAACVICGEKTPEVLTRVRRSLLEQHHLGGITNDGRLVVIACRNHHAQLTEAGRVSGIDLIHDANRPTLRRLEAVLRGLADFFQLLVIALRGWAEEVARIATQLENGRPWCEGAA